MRGLPMIKVKSNIIVSLTILVLGITVLLVLVWLSRPNNQAVNTADIPNIFNTNYPIVKQEELKAAISDTPDPFKEYLTHK
jgi:ABC-type uncharacterized transport system permease subunit